MQYSSKDTLRLAKRINNARRSYLLVNPLQAKHMPVSPSRALEMMQTLGRQLAEKHPKARLVIGFAETATAIGAAVASCLHAECKYLQTTREACEGSSSWLEFNEEHSHAVEQKLCAQQLGQWINETEQVIMVDDELSTGKTLINIIEQIRSAFPAAKDKPFVAASILNRLSPENDKRLRDNGITAEYLVKLEDEDLTEKVEHFSVAPTMKPCCEKLSEYVQLVIRPSLMNMRYGAPIAEYQKSCEAFAATLLERAKLPKKQDARILVLGTEECMYPSLVFSRMLEERNPGMSVFCHATTRSPIGVLDDPAYPVRSGFALRSFYDEARATFIYNLAAYDAAIVISDAPQGITSGRADLLAALSLSGCKSILIAEGENHV